MRSRADSGLAALTCGRQSRTTTMRQVMKTIDAHVAGEPLRLVVDGVPRPTGKTMAQKRDWMKRHADQVRRALVLEPRGQRDMCAAMSGHSVIAAATIAIESGLLFSRDVSGPEARIVFDTPAGTVHARARLQARGDSHRVDSVVFTNVPSFVASGGHSVRLGTRELRVDVAFGGLFYAIADTEAIGI